MSQDPYCFEKRANMWGQNVAIKLAVLIATFTMEVATHAPPLCSKPTLGFYSQSTRDLSSYIAKNAFDNNPSTFAHTEYKGGYELRPWIQAKIVEGDPGGRVSLGQPCTAVVDGFEITPRQVGIGLLGRTEYIDRIDFKYVDLWTGIYMHRKNLNVTIENYAPFLRTLG